MIRRDYLSWWFRPHFLRRGGPKKPTLFVGPWVGEFGWELLNWQAFVRALSREYDSTVVCCRRGNEALYADFATDFVPHQIRGTAECNQARQIENPREVQRVLDLVPRDADHLKPLGHQPLTRQQFIPFGERQADLETDVLFHPRGRNFGTDRNWNESKWEALISSLSRQGLRVGCIGLSRATVDVDGDIIDHRDVPLDQTMNLIASTRLVIGPSSGPMHLASLCKTPHLVWTDKRKWARGMTSRMKYERYWNPFQTEAIVIDEFEFDPPVEEIEKDVLRHLSVPVLT